MMNQKKLGIWMDNSSAHVMEYDNGTLSSKILASHFTHGEKEKSLAKNENLMHNKEQHQQADYYKRLGAIIRDYSEVVIFGPTNAKQELVNKLKEDQHFEKVKIEVEQADKMTENQRMAFVKDHFSK